VRENAEEVLLAGVEPRLGERLRDRLGALVGNLRRIIAVNRNLGFFTTGYNWLIQIIPALIIAPAYMEGRVEFGVVTQSAMAFSTLVAAFSLIVTQFQSISSFTAVVARLSSLVDAVETSKLKTPATGEAPGIRMEDGAAGLRYEALTLRSEGDGRVLIGGLSASIPLGGRLLIRAEDEAATLALFRATAGVYVRGEGRVIRPRAQDLRFLAERPYLTPGSLRGVLLPAPMESAIPDARVLELLDAWGLESVVARAGGLDGERDWDSILSLAEQQRLACVWVLLGAPRLVLLDRPGTTLGAARIDGVLNRFSTVSIGYVQLGGPEGPITCYDSFLEIQADGRWSWRGDPPAWTAMGHHKLGRR
jgi:putative ATP-binding cassette transporter